MNFKTTIVLFILLAIVGGYFYFVEYGNMTGYEAHELQQDNQTIDSIGDPVFTDDALTGDQIDRIELTRGGRSITAQKQGDQWYQTKPVRFKLDSYTPDAVANQFADLRYVQRIAPNTTDEVADTPSVAQMGLEKPRAVVTVGIGDKTWTLKLGRLAVDGHGYAQVEGEDTAYVVEPAIFGTLLDQQTNDWRSKSLGSFDAAGSDRITLHTSDGDLIDLHKLEGTWWFDTDTVQRTNQEAISELFTTLSGVWITGFIEDNPDNLNLYGLDNPHLELILQTPVSPEIYSDVSGSADHTSTSNTLTHRLKVGRTDLEGKARYATWSRDGETTLAVFTIDAATADSLKRNTDDLRDPRVSTVDAKDVRGLTVTQNGETTLHILRDPQTGYRFGEPKPAFEIDYSTTHALIRKLCELESTAYTTALNDLGEPVAQVTLGTATEGDVKLAIHRTGDNHTFITEGEGVGYIVEGGDLVQQLTGPSLSLRKRTILDVAAEEISRISLRRGDNVTYEFTTGDTESGWTLAEHTDFEDTTLDALIAGLNPLRATDWLAEPVTPSADWTALSLELKDGTTTELQTDPVSRQATVTGAGNGFILSQPFVDLLTAEYRDRSLHLPSVNQIESIRLYGGSVAVTLSRDGQQYISDHGEVDQAMAAKTFDTLAGLRVQRYVAPLHIIPEMIDFTLEATTQDGDKVTLRVLSGDDPELATVTIDPDHGADYKGWFTLRKSYVQALRTALTDLQSPTK